MNLPNKLTILRVLMIPPFVAALLSGSWTGRMIALVLFCAASFTDFLDGYIARRDHLVTNFGKFMDPLADKMLVCSALICLVQMNRLAAWVVIILISREFIISGFRLIASDNGIVIAASMWGKVKTVCQMVMTIVLILHLEQAFWQGLEAVLTVASVVLTLVSLVDYIWKNRSVLTEGGSDGKGDNS